MTWARREPLAAPRSERTRTGVTSTSVVRSPPPTAPRAEGPSGWRSSIHSPAADATTISVAMAPEIHNAIRRPHAVGSCRSVGRTARSLPRSCTAIAPIVLTSHHVPAAHARRGSSEPRPASDGDQLTLGQALPLDDGCDAALLESGDQPPHPGETGVVLVAGRDDLRAVDPVLQLVLDGPPHPVPVGFQIRQD